MITQANGSDIWVANTLNRIYFGTSATGSCADTTAYTLGGPAGGNSMESPIRTSNQNLPNSGMTLCIDGETGTCSFSGIKEVFYGAGSTDLLVTWLYNLTVNTMDYNLASVIGILIFILSAVFSLLAYTRTNSFKEG